MTLLLKLLPWSRQSKEEMERMEKLKRLDEDCRQRKAGLSSHYWAAKRGWENRRKG